MTEQKRIYKSWKSIFTIMLLSLFCLSSPIVAQENGVTEIYTTDSLENAVDSSAVVVAIPPLVSSKPTYRIPSEKSMKEYQNQDKFRYKTVEEDTDLSILSWIVIQIAKAIMYLIVNPVTFWIILILGVGLIIYLIARYAGVDFLSMVKKKEINEVLDISLENLGDENDYDFDKYIKTAIQNENYRLAVRLHFLKNLKTLVDREVIKWDKRKTNNSYTSEITNPNIRNSYAHNSRIFDYIWYGEIEINRPVFDSIYQQYETFYKDVTHYYATK